MKIFIVFLVLNIINYLFGGILVDKFDLYIKILRLFFFVLIGFGIENVLVGSLQFFFVNFEDGFKIVCLVFNQVNCNIIFSFKLFEI